MQIITVLVAAIGTMVMAQDVSKIPVCCQDCIVNLNSLSGCKSILDFPCLCKAPSKYNDEIAKCIVKSCKDFNDVQAMTKWKTDTCAKYGVKWP